MKLDYSMLPLHMQDPARMYIEDGIEPGSFLRAVLEDKLVASMGAADSVNIRYMFEWANWLYNVIPADAWHNRENVDRWISLGGLNGILKKQSEPIQ